MTRTLPRHRREFERFLKFTVVGGIGFLVDFTSFNLLITVLRVPSVFASVFSFTAAVLSNFIWNRYWTYRDSRSKPVHEQAGQFLLVNLIGLVIRTPIFALVEGPTKALASRLLEDPLLFGDLARSIRISPGVIGSNLALGVAVVVVLFWNFGANRIWTYSDAA